VVHLEYPDAMTAKQLREIGTAYATRAVGAATREIYQLPRTLTYKLHDFRLLAFNRRKIAKAGHANCARLDLSACGLSFVIASAASIGWHVSYRSGLSHRRANPYAAGTCAKFGKRLAVSQRPSDSHSVLLVGSVKIVPVFLDRLKAFLPIKSSFQYMEKFIVTLLSNIIEVKQLVQKR
jgi:hypothetical protein